MTLTYADLMTGAGIELAAATDPTRLPTRPAPGRAVEAEIAGRAAVLDAVAAQVWAIVGPARRSGISHGNDPTEQRAVALARELHQILGTDQPPTRARAASTTAWHRAATGIRAASDLLSTHFDHNGRPRSPDAEHWSTTAGRAALLRDLGPLTTRALAAEDHLAVRAGQAGLSWSQIRALLPDTTTARDLAEHLHPEPTADTVHGLGHLALIGQPPRVDSPTHELLDRLAHTRQLTWQLLKHPDHSTATLRDLAILATAVHAHTAAHLTTLGRPSSRTVEQLTGRARAWQEAAHDLAGYLTPAPGDHEIHHQVRAITTVLGHLAPLRGGPSTPELDPGQVTSVLRSAIATTDKLGAWAAHTFDHLAAHTDLYIRGTTLTRDQVNDHPDLAHAKLTGTRVLAPPSVIDHTAARYRTALTTTSTPTSGTPTARATGRTTDAMVIRRQPAST